MTISSDNLVILSSERNTDFADGGGFETATIIADGSVNQLFQPVAAIDRAYGAVQLREAYAGVASQNADPLLKGYVVLTKAPTEAAVAASLFGIRIADTIDLAYQHGQLVADAREYIESYLVMGPIQPMWLLEDHLPTQNVLVVYLAENATMPMVGSVLCLSVEHASYPATVQFVRIAEILQNELVEYHNEQYGRFTRRQLMLSINPPLTAIFPSNAAQPFTQNEAVPTKIRSTQLTPDAAYYGIRKLLDDVSSGEFDLRVASIETQLVPATIQNVPFLDYAPFAARVINPLLAEIEPLTRTIAGIANAITTLHFPAPLRPGSLTIEIGALIFKDNAQGVFVVQNGDDDGYTLTVNYNQKTIAATRAASYNTSIRITGEYAAPISAPFLSQVIQVTTSNRRAGYTFNLDPLPEPGSVQVEYLTGGNWLTLRDDGHGRLLGAANEGSGTYSSITGSGAIALGALPDAPGWILITWCKVGVFTAVVSYAAPTPLNTLPGYTLPAVPLPFVPGANEPPGNQAPIADAGPPQVVAQGAVVQLDGSGSLDPESQQLSYQWQILSRPWNAVDNLSNANIVNPTITPNVGGEWRFQLTVFDGWKTATDTVLITVTSVVLPVANPGGNRRVNAAGTLIVLDGRRSIATSVLWALESKPSGSTTTLTNPTTLTPSLTPDRAGDYVVSLTATVGTETAVDTITVTVGASRPVVNAGADTTGTTGIVKNLSATATQAEDETLSYLWTVVSSPAVVVITGATTLTPSFTPPVSGVYVLQFLANCAAYGFPVEDTITVVVTDASPPPTTPPVAVITGASSGTVGQSLTLSSSTSQPSSLQGPITRRWSVAVPTGSPITATGTGVELVFTPAISGNHVFTLVVQSDSLEHSTTRTIVVAAAPPIIISEIPIAAVIGAAIPLRVDVISPPADGPPAITFSLTARPQGSTAAIIEPAGHAELTPDVAGTYVVRATVTADGATATSDTAITVTSRPTLPDTIPSDIPAIHLTPPAPAPRMPGQLQSLGAMLPGVLWVLSHRPIPGKGFLSYPGGRVAFGEYGSLEGGLLSALGGVYLQLTSPPAKGSTFTANYWSSDVDPYTLTVLAADYPDPDPYTGRMTFVLPGAIRLGSVEVELNITQDERYGFDGLEFVGPYADYTAKTRDDGAGNLLSGYPSFSRINYDTGVIEIDARALDNPETYYRLGYNRRFLDTPPADDHESVVIRALPIAPMQVFVETMILSELIIDVSNNLTFLETPQVVFAYAGHVYYEDEGILKRDMSPTTGVGTPAGRIDLAGQKIIIEDW